MTNPNCDCPICTDTKPFEELIPEIVEKLKEKGLLDPDFKLDE